MPDPNPYIATDQFRSLLRSFAFDPPLIAGYLLSDEQPGELTVESTLLRGLHARGL